MCVCVRELQGTSELAAHCPPQAKVGRCLHANMLSMADTQGLN